MIIIRRLGSKNTDVYIYIFPGYEYITGIWQGTTDIALKKLKDQEQMKEFIAEVSILQYDRSIYPSI